MRLPKFWLFRKSNRSIITPQPPKSLLAKINVVLIILILITNGYVFARPLWPRISFWVHEHHPDAVAGLPYKTNLNTDQLNGQRLAIPKDNRLVIPKLRLNEHIYVGSDPYLVNKGVWARPQASTPPNGSNTVLVGHRFTYDGPATFYNLDKVAAGDNIVIYWRSKEYDYVIRSTTVVPPTDVAIENPTANSQLTIYTCTPLWSAKDRLVIVANLIKPGSVYE